MDAGGGGGRGFRDLRVWQEAITLAAVALRVANQLPSNLAGLADQVLRAATSVHANIAEGAGHRSRREFIRFLRIAQASLTELESHLAFVERASLAPAREVREVTTHTRRVHQLLRGLLRALENPGT